MEPLPPVAAEPEQLGDLRRRWAGRHDNHVRLQSRAHDLGQRMTAVVKFVRYTQQSLSLGMGALLAIHGEITVGAMIAANVLMSRASPLRRPWATPGLGSPPCCS